VMEGDYHGHAEIRGFWENVLDVLPDLTVEERRIQRNLVALRAEERLALGLYRPSAFTAVSGLT